MNITSQEETKHYATKKFRKVYEKCFVELDKGVKGKLSFVEFCMMLKQLGCVEKDDAGVERELLRLLWELLEGEKQGGASMDNLFTALKSIFKLDICQHAYESSRSEIIDQGLGFSQNGELIVSDSQSQQLHQLFFSFYLKSRYEKKLEKTTLLSQNKKNRISLGIIPSHNCSPNKKKENQLQAGTSQYEIANSKVTANRHIILYIGNN